jgi:hypothetical protein
MVSLCGGLGERETRVDEGQRLSAWRRRRRRRR